MALLAPPDPNWPLLADAEGAVWRKALSVELIAIHHIGSTAVANLPAKPIIDLLPVASTLAALDRATPSLVAAGYEAMGPFGLHGRRYFRKSSPEGQRLIHAHAYAAGDPSIDRHLAFRDLLRRDPDIRAAYAEVKRAADAASGGDINRYMDLKDSFIKTHEALALRRDPSA